MQKHQWLGEVLDDIGIYAEQEGLSEVQKAIESVRLVYLYEVAYVDDRDISGSTAQIIPFPQ